MIVEGKNHDSAAGYTLQFVLTTCIDVVVVKQYVQYMVSIFCTKNILWNYITWVTMLYQLEDLKNSQFSSILQQKIPFCLHTCSL